MTDVLFNLIGMWLALILVGALALSGAVAAIALAIMMLRSVCGRSR
jgi:hypothetical protein